MGKHTPHVRQLELNYLVGIFVADHLTRMHEAFDGDLVAALVLATIANRNMERYYEDVARRSAEGLDRLVEQRAHVGQLRHSNAHSVASATGIPRETVRRKVKWLVERGWIRVGERGELSIAEGIAQQFAQFNAETVERFLDTARRSLDIAGRPVATPRAADADVSQPQKS